MHFLDLDIDVRGQTSGKAYTPCPKCSAERKPSNRNKKCLTVNCDVGNQWWNCNHCGWKGNLDVHGKYDEVKKKAKVPDEIPKYSKSFFHFWEQRKITEPTLRKAHVYEDVVWMPPAGKGKGTKRPAICYPYYNGSYLVVNVKYRDLNSKAFRVISKDDGAEFILWGTDAYDPTNPEVIITEGENDRLAYMEAGFPNVLSVPMGAPNPKAENLENEFAYLKLAIPMLKGAKKIFVAADNDEAGIRLRQELGRRLGKERCCKVTFGKWKDPNELLIEEGVDKLKESIAKAVPFPIEGIIRPRDIDRAEYELFYKHGFKRGLIAGLPGIDKCYSVKRKLLTVLTGTPQSGKTEWLITYLTNLVQHNIPQGMKIAIFSPESRPILRLINRIACIKAGRSTYHNDPNRMSFDELMAMVAWVDEHFIFINPTDHRNLLAGAAQQATAENANARTLKGILNFVRILVEQEGIFGYVIDPWNKIEHQREGKQSEKEYISSCLDMILGYGELFDVHGWVIAHPTKIYTDQKSGNKREVHLEDISGAAEWESKADVGIALQRKFYYYDKDEKDWVFDKDLPTLVQFQKMKFAEIGELGSVEMWFDLFGGGRFVEDKLEVKAKPTTPNEISAEDLPF